VEAQLKDYFPWPKSSPFQFLPFSVRRYKLEKEDCWYIASITMEAVEEAIIKPPARIRLWKPCFTRYKDLLDLDPKYPKSAIHMQKAQVKDILHFPESHSFAYLDVSENIFQVSIEITYRDPLNKARDLMTQIYIPYEV